MRREQVGGSLSPMREITSTTSERLCIYYFYNIISKQDFVNLSKVQNLKPKIKKIRQCCKIAHGIVKPPPHFGIE
jgi:hypothetical protein